MSTLFYLSNHIGNIESPLIQTLGSGIQLLGCGSYYKIEYSQSTDNRIELTAVQKTAMTACDIALGILMLVTLLPTVIAFVAKMISNDERTASLFNAVMVYAVSAENPPIGSELALYKPNLAGLRFAPCIQQDDLDDLQTLADRSGYDFATVMSEANRLFETTHPTLIRLIDTEKKFDYIEHLVGEKLGDGGKLGRQIKAKSRLFAYLFTTKCKDDNEKKTMLHRLAFAMEACEETWEKEFSDLATDIYFSRLDTTKNQINPTTGKPTNFVVERILYALQSLKIQMLITGFQDKTTYNLPQWHFIDSIKYLLADQLGLPKSTNDSNYYAAVEGYECVNPTNIIKILQSRYTTHSVVHEVKSLLNAPGFQRRVATPILNEMLCGRIPDEAERAMYIYNNFTNIPDDQMAKLTNADIIAILQGMDILVSSTIDSRSTLATLQKEMDDIWSGPQGLVHLKALREAAEKQILTSVLEDNQAIINDVVVALTIDQVVVDSSTNPPTVLLGPVTKNALNKPVLPNPKNTRIVNGEVWELRPGQRVVKGKLIY